MVESVGSSTRQVRFQLGTDYLNTASRNAVASPLHAVEEFIANAWDADARIVRVSYDGKTVSIEDDGTGMSPTEVQERFFKIGDSHKVDSKSSRGREFMGSFGLAKFGVRALARKFRLETTKGGEKSTVEYRFPDIVRLNDPMPLSVYPANRETHGTKLLLEELLVTEESGFNEKSIKSHVISSMPVEDPEEFAIIINGQRLTPISIDNADTFDFNYTGAHLGQAKGIIYLTKQPLKEAGVYIKVNKRKIGDPKTIVNLNELNDSTARRIVVRINADGLAGFIRSDRGGFRPCPAYDELLKAVRRSLSEVNRFAELRTNTSKTRNIGNKRSLLLKGAYHMLELRGIEEIATQGVHVVFASDLQPDVQARFDESEGLIKLNANYPTLSVGRVPNAAVFRNNILSAVAEAIAEKRSKGNLESYKRQRLLLLDRLQERISTSGESSSALIFPSLHYSVPALSKVADRSLNTLRYFVERGVLHETGEGIVGGEYSLLVEKTKGLLPLPEFLQKYMGLEVEGTFYTQISRLEEIFGKIRVEAAPFVLAGGNGKPAYFLEDSCGKEIAEVIKAMDLRSSANPADFFTDLRRRFMNMKEIEAKTSLKLPEIQGVVSYATTKQIQIRRNETNRIVSYHLGDFISALQNSRDNDVYLKQN